MAQPAPLVKVAWTDAEVAANSVARFSFGPLVIHAGRAGPEWHLAWKRTRGPEEARAWSPEESEWTRLTGAGPESVLRFAPALPDRDLVLALVNPLLLLRHAKTRVFAGIPVRVRAALLSGESEIVLSEIPSAPLTNSWQGKPTSGRLCYWKKSRATPKPDDTYGEEYAFCPVELVNREARDLALERLEIPLPRLGLWDANGRLWTSAVKLSFSSSSDFDVTVEDGKAPEERPDAAKAAPPRSGGKGLLDVKDLNPLKLFSDWRL